MSSGYRISDQNKTYFLTFQIVGWVDLFTRKVYRDIVIDSLKFCQEKKGLNLFAYVIMSNHMHLLAQSENDDLSGIIRDFKRFTSRQFIDFIENGSESRRDWLRVVFAYHGMLKSNQENQIWTHENHAELIYSQKFIEQKVNYIHNNPVKSGIVVKPEDYLYSSARNYADLESVIDVIKVDFIWKTY
ncbi:MAG TPA: transposase [Bacteroidales bacterium]|nr:transposase [Bacteroidales bacterium]